MEYFLLVLLGILGGVLGGMGMGGGTIIIPLLTIFLGLGQKIAQGYNLFSFLIMSVFALCIHFKNKMINFKSIIILVISGILFCIGGAFLVKIVDSQILKYFFAGFLIIVAILEFVKVFKTK